MIKPHNSFSILIIMLIFMVSMCGCTNHDSSFLPLNQYVAIEEEKYDNGVLIAGTPGIPEAPLPPIFYYDNTIPRYSYPPDYPLMNDSLKILYGTFYTDSTPEYLRKRLNVHGIYEYTYPLESGPIITNVDRNGTVQMTYDNESINLNVNDAWTSPVISTRVVNLSGTSARLMNDSVIGGNYTYTVKYTTTWKVTNRGVFDKGKSKLS